jgi:hypothetical protein
MTAKRAAAYFGGASLLLAWLASAAGLVRQTPEVSPSPTPVVTSGTETLAADVQAQALRLKERLAAAPLPQEPLRNPFRFAERDAPARREQPSAPADPVPPPLAAPVEPALELIGVAEDQTAQGLVRTAIVTALTDELFLVKEGETIGGRYRVKTVGSDAVELTDLVSGMSRRLALRH